MKHICMDVQPLIKNKSGIGWYTYKLFQNIIQQKENDFEISASGFDFLGRNSTKKTLPELGFDKNHIHKIVPARVYNAISQYIPLKYDNIFSDADLYHFFYFIVPPINDKKKVIVNVYDMVYKLYPETMHLKFRQLLDKKLNKSINRANQIITISKSAKNDILKFYDLNEKNIEIVYPGLDYEFYQQGQYITQQKENEIREKYKLPKKFILYLGTIEPRKNIETIFKAYANLYKDIKEEYKLVISGSKGWGFENILELPKKLNISENVIYTNYVDENDKPYIYAMAKIFLFPSLYEGFGMPIAEAMVSGTPVITADNSSLKEAGGNGASYVSALDYAAINKEILKYLSDDTYTLHKVNEGQQYARKFSWEKSALKTINIYKQMLEK